MATEGSTEKAHWNDKETNALLDVMYEHRAEAGDGSNFKKTTYTAAEAALKSASLLTSGPQKTAKWCKTKWNSVCSIKDYFY